MSKRNDKKFCEAAAGLMNWNELVEDTDINVRYPKLGGKIRDLRTLVVEHRENWKAALVEKILTEGGLRE